MTITDVDLYSTAPGTPGGRFMRMFWHPVAFASDLPKGRIAPFRLMSEDYTLYRGDDDVLSMVAPRCAHRGTSLAVGWVEGSCIRCRYHGWLYDGTGQCLEAPAERDRLATRTRIAAYPTREYLGLVFVYVGPGEAPEFPSYPEWEQSSALEATGYLRDCNYFQNLENGLDPLHSPFTHRDSAITTAGLGELPTLSAQCTEWGVTVETVRSSGTRTLLYGVPNISNVLIPATYGGWKQSLAWRVPIDDHQHRSFILYDHLCGADDARRHGVRLLDDGHGWIESSREHLRALFDGRLTLEELDLEPDELIDLQDVVAQVGQGAIADRSGERLGRSDVGVIQLRRIWKEQLQAVSDGRPPANWHRPSGLVAQGERVQPDPTHRVPTASDRGEAHS